MSTRTRPQQRTTTSSRRFGRTGATSQRRRTPSARTRSVPVTRRRKSQASGKGKGLQALSGLLAGRSAKKATGKGAKAGAGVAMLTAAAGLAFKNRDRLTSMLKRDGGAPVTDPSAPPAGTTGSTVHPVTSGTSMDAAEPSGAMSSPGSGLGNTGSATSSPGSAGTPSSLDPPATSLGGTGSSSSLDAPGAPSPLDPAEGPLDPTGPASAQEPPADPTGSPAPFDPDAPPPAGGSRDEPQ
jgi:hypothetical protein